MNPLEPGQHEITGAKKRRVLAGEEVDAGGFPFPGVVLTNEARPLRASANKMVFSE